MRIRRFSTNLLIVITALATTLLLTTGESRADFYSYVDSSGKMHFTNTPHSGFLKKNKSDFKWHMSERGAHRSQAGYLSYDELIRKISKKHSMDPELVKAVVKAESNFNPNAVSRVGARGLMQLMPDTAKYLGVKNIDDPSDNVDGGVRYLKYLMEKFDSKLPLVLAAYNAGENVVRRYNGIPPYKETKRYVKKVLAYKKQYTEGGR